MLCAPRQRVAHARCPGRPGPGRCRVPAAAASGPCHVSAPALPPQGGRPVSTSRVPPAESGKGARGSGSLERLQSSATPSAGVASTAADDDVCKTTTAPAVSAGTRRVRARNVGACHLKHAAKTVRLWRLEVAFKCTHRTHAGIHLTFRRGREVARCAVAFHR